MNLVGDRKGCGKRLSENGYVVGYLVRDGMEVFFRKTNILRENSLMSSNPCHGACSTMARPVCFAKVTGTAGIVDFAHNAFAVQGTSLCDNLPDKFMPGHTPKSHVSLNQFEIGVTNSALPDPDQDFAR
jgi:hypothetical protein